MKKVVIDHLGMASRVCGRQAETRLSPKTILTAGHVASVWSEIDYDGKAVQVSTERLKQVLKASPASEAEFSADDEFLCITDDLKMTAKLKRLTYTSFSPFGDILEASIVVDIDYPKPLSWVAKASRRAGRTPVVACYPAKEDLVYIVATDGYRLHAMSAPATIQDAEDHQKRIPLMTPELAEVLSKAERVRLSFDRDERMTAETDGHKIVSLLVADSYPDVGRYFSAAGHRVWTFDRAELERAVRFCSPQGETYPVVSIEVRHKGSVVTSGCRTLYVELDGVGLEQGEDFTQTMASKFLLDALAGIPGEGIAQTEDENSVLFLRPQDNDQVSACIMPIRT